MRNKEFPKEVKLAADTIEKWLSQNGLDRKAAIVPSFVDLETGDIKYSIYLG